MGNKRLILALVALIGAGLACTAPGAATQPVTAEGAAPTVAETAVQPPTVTPPGASAAIKAILDFYPLAKGATWVYQVTIDTGGGPGGAAAHKTGRLTATVTDATTVDGTPVFTVEWSADPGLPVADLGTRYVVIREAGIYETASQENIAALAGSEVFTDVALIPWPLQDGQVWGDPAFMRQNVDGLYVWHLATANPVTVPAGTFTSCYQATLTTNPDSTFRWFCAGVGLVRYQYHHHGSLDDRLWELESFTRGS